MNVGTRRAAGLLWRLRGPVEALRQAHRDEAGGGEVVRALEDSGWEASIHAVSAELGYYLLVLVAPDDGASALDDSPGLPDDWRGCLSPALSAAVADAVTGEPTSLECPSAVLSREATGIHEVVGTWGNGR